MSDESVGAAMSATQGLKLGIVVAWYIVCLGAATLVVPNPGGLEEIILGPVVTAMMGFVFWAFTYGGYRIVRVEVGI